MDFTLKHIVVLTVILGTIFVIISENRNPVKTIAWCMVLAFMPVVGLVLYILFGMDNRHRKLVKDEDLGRFKGVTELIQGRASALGFAFIYQGGLERRNQDIPVQERLHARQDPGH